MTECMRPLEPLDDLHLAVTVGESAQTSIQHADTKAAILLGGHVSAAAFVLSETGPVSVVALAGVAATVLAVGLTALTVVGTLGAGWHLGSCLAPRLRGPAGDNRFALPNLAASGALPAGVPVDQQRDEAWAVAVTLAQIAMRKHLAIRASLPWITVSLIASVALLGCSVILGGQ